VSEARLDPALTRHAACGERQDLQARLRDLLAAVAADTIPPGVDVGERAINLLQLARACVDDRRHDLVVVRDRRHAKWILEDLAAVIVVA
jgi:hypothetical protein